MSIRIAKSEDAPALLAIYTPYILETAVTFEYTVPSVEAFQKRVETTLEKYPYLVAQEADGTLLGYAYAGPFGERAAYSWSAEASVYLRPDCRRQGTGHKLYAALESLLKIQGFVNLEAAIASPSAPDDPYLTDDSIRFHAHEGYRQAGRFEASGYKFSRWYDLIWMEKQIGAHQKVMAPVRPFPEIIDQAKTLLENF